MNENMRLRGTAEIVLRGPDGRIKERHVEDNLIVDIGFDNLNSLIRGSGGSALTHMGIGWAEPQNTPSAPAAGDLNLPMPGGTPPLVGGKQDRVVAAVSKIDEKNWKLVASWGSGEPASAGSFPVPIESVGAFWASGSGNNELFSWIRRAQINKASVDTLEVTYTFTMS